MAVRKLHTRGMTISDNLEMTIAEKLSLRGKKNKVFSRVLGFLGFLGL